MKNVFDAFSACARQADLLDMVYRDLKKGELRRETADIVKMFYEKPKKFADVYLREERRKAGCRTYTDSSGKTRMIATGRLEIEEFLANGGCGVFGKGIK